MFSVELMGVATNSLSGGDAENDISNVLIEDRKTTSRVSARQASPVFQSDKGYITIARPHSPGRSKYALSFAFHIFSFNLQRSHQHLSTPVINRIQLQPFLHRCCDDSITRHASSRVRLAYFLMDRCSPYLMIFPVSV